MWIKGGQVMAGLFAKVDTVVVRVRDIDQAKQWYQEVLELQVTSEQNTEYKIVMLAVGNVSLMLYELQAHEELAGRQFVTGHPIFFAEDIATAHARLTERGVEVDELQQDGGIQFFLFRDLDGNQLEVCHY